VSAVIGDRRIDIGARVRWRSQSGGVWKEKVGVVIRVVADGVRPALKGCGAARDHESFLVEVREGKRKRTYWPRVMALELVEPSPLSAGASP
jgi:hypothetical protein